MSSVARGNAFENRVFEVLKQELAGDRIGISPNLATPFKKKGYYSENRKSNIVVDISIEVWLPGADHWSILWVCECKDYSGTVPVNDVEEFKAKLDQITGANKKGVMVVSSALQEAAINYARSNGIGIIRLLPDEQIEHMLYLTTSSMLDNENRLDASEFSRALREPDFVGINRDFYAISDGYIFGNWLSLLKEHLRKNSRLA